MVEEGCECEVLEWFIDGREIELFCIPVHKLIIKSNDESGQVRTAELVK